MHYLTAGQILLIHSLAIDETGGSHGVRDHHAVLSIKAMPKQQVFGRELYPTVFEKAAVYARGIILSHPFIDGNKRTGLTAAAVFLENNGYRLAVRQGGVEQFALEIATEKLDMATIAAWFRRNSRKIRER